MIKDTKRAVIVLLSIAVTIGALWFTNRTVTPKEANWDGVVAEAKVGGYKLIGTDELWERYRNAPDTLLVVDTRQEWEYRTGHIKDAVNFPMEPTWLSRWQRKGDLEALIGPVKDRPVVFY